MKAKIKKDSETGNHIGIKIKSNNKIFKIEETSHGVLSISKEIDGRAESITSTSTKKKIFIE